MLTSSLLHARSFAIATAITLAASASFAQAPPDLPPISPAPGSTPPPAAAPAVTPPAMKAPPRMAPPGFSWSTPSAVPPGYGYPTGYYAPPPQPPTRAEDYALAPPPPRRRNDIGVWAGGVVMVGAGVIAAIAGAALVSSAADRIDIYCDSPSFPCAHKDDDARKAAGIIMMAGGALMAAVGIPMWVVGSKFVPVSPTPNPHLPKTTLVPEVRVGAGTATLTLRF